MRWIVTRSMLKPRRFEPRWQRAYGNPVTGTGVNEVAFPPLPSSPSTPKPQQAIAPLDAARTCAPARRSRPWRRGGGVLEQLSARWTNVRDPPRGAETAQNYRRGRRSATDAHASGLAQDKPVERERGEGDGADQGSDAGSACASGSRS